MAENQSNTPLIRIGGDASDAKTAFDVVRDEMRKMRGESQSVAKSLGSAFSQVGRGFSLLYSGVKKIGSFIGSTLSAAWHKLKWAIVGVAGAIGLSIRAWQKEASAQARINSMLKANVKDYKTARSELSKITSQVMRRTNFDDRQVEGVFNAFMVTNRGRGFGIAKRFLPTILDLASAKGEDPESIAQMVGRALASGQTTMLQRQGIMVDKGLFKRDREQALYNAISGIAPGSAEAERQANPWAASWGNFTEILEQVGRVFSTKLSPYVDRAANVFLDIAEKLEDADLPTMIKDTFTILSRAVQNAWAMIKQFAASLFSSGNDNVKGYMPPAHGRLQKGPYAMPASAAGMYSPGGTAALSRLQTQPGAQQRTLQIPVSSGVNDTGQPFDNGALGVAERAFDWLVPSWLKRKRAAIFNSPFGGGGRQGVTERGGGNYWAGLMRPFSWGNFGDAWNSANNMALPFKDITAGTIFGGSGKGDKEEEKPQTWGQTYGNKASWFAYANSLGPRIRSVVKRSAWDDENRKVAQLMAQAGTPNYDSLVSPFGATAADMEAVHAKQKASLVAATRNATQELAYERENERRRTDVLAFNRTRHEMVPVM